jgi:hypothetical protein
MELAALLNAASRIRAEHANVIKALKDAIRKKETELAELRTELAIAEGHAGRAVPPMRNQRTGGRRDWHAVLDQLPVEFAAPDISAVPGMGKVEQKEIFAAITRWIKAGRARRLSRGVYRKVTKAAI